MSERGSRLRASVLTFGPVGRVVCTVVLLAVPYWFLVYAGFFGLFGAVVWIGWVLPGALRDTWRPAALPPTDLTRLRDAAALEAERLTKADAVQPGLRPGCSPARALVAATGGAVPWRWGTARRHRRRPPPPAE